jgi:hypothetical protein
MGFEIFLECSRFLTRVKCDSGFYPPRSILCCVRTATFVVFVQAGFKIVGETSVASTRLYQAFQDVNVVEAFQISFSRLACQGEVRSDTYFAIGTFGPASTRSTPWQASFCASLRTILYSGLACQGEVRSDTYFAIGTFGPASTGSTPWQSSFCASLRTKPGGGGGSRTRVRKTST